MVIEENGLTGDSSPCSAECTPMHLERTSAVRHRSGHALCPPARGVTVSCLVPFPLPAHQSQAGWKLLSFGLALLRSSLYPSKITSVLKLTEAAAPAGAHAGNPDLKRDALQSFLSPFVFHEPSNKHVLAPARSWACIPVLGTRRWRTGTFCPQGAVLEYVHACGGRAGIAGNTMILSGVPDVFLLTNYSLNIQSSFDL